MSRKFAPKFQKVSFTNMGEILCGINTIRPSIVDVLKYRRPEDHSLISKVEEFRELLHGSLVSCL